jgi:transposase
MKSRIFLMEALPPERKEGESMEIVYQVCCGIDVHVKMLVACLICHGKKETRTFSTMTDDLLKLLDWLVAAGCKHVAIESTGVYWKPVFNILESALTVVLINPQHAKALQGRKTDVKDAQWLADLLQHGLLKPSFIPPVEIRELRELTRYRETLIRDHTSVANRIQKSKSSSSRAT